MSIQPYGDVKFNCDIVYFGIYATEPLLLNDLLIGFGPVHHCVSLSKQIVSYYDGIEKQRIFLEK